MFSTLIASGAARTSDDRGTVPSVLLHLGVIAAMIVATQAADPQIEAPRTSRIVPLAAPFSAPRNTPPQPRAPTRPQPVPTTPSKTPELLAVPIEAPAELPTGIPMDAPAAPQTGGGNADPSTVPITEPSTDGGSPSGLSSGSEAYSAEGVDVPVRLRAGSPVPRYPEVLRQSRVTGYVRVRFVVGADGRAEMGTLEILEETHAAFAQSVRSVLPRLRFTPARVGQRAVRQLVEIPFGFELR